ncbi:MAG: amino acid permease [Ruminiclostridium sp.]|nr:amino acid permease [Ruminiclostridium sp.]
MEEKDGKETGLTRYLSPNEAWALSFGCIVGWGAFVMPGNSFLPMAGPVGTAVGMAIGAVIMLIIGMNYSYMMNVYPDEGGTYAYADKVFDHDHGFLGAWFIILSYLALLWANITALTLVMRNIFGDIFCFGFLYNIAGYDIYIGEVLLELGIMAVCGLLCCVSKKAAGVLQTVFALLLLVGVIACFIIALVNNKDPMSGFEPAFASDRSVFSQIAGVVTLTPWAFIGFESVSHSSKEFKFPIRKTYFVIAAAIAAGFLTYTMTTLTAVTARPEGFANWEEYISSAGSLDGIQGMPVFYAVETAAGETGKWLLFTALLGGIVTGIIGAFTASGRLVRSMASEGILPVRFGRLGKKNAPKNAILLVMAISVVIPFLGRNATVWVVDVMTVGALVAYGYTSACAFKMARIAGNKKIRVTGLIGIIVSGVMCLFLMIPNLFSMSEMEAPSYLLLAFWSIIGILFFRYVFMKDTKRLYGNSVSIWIVLLFIVFFTSLMWIRQSNKSSADNVIMHISEYYEDEIAGNGIELSDETAAENAAFISEETEEINNALTNTGIIQIGLIALSLVIVANVYSKMQKREKHLEKKRVQAEESSKAKSAFLSNMSHDLRTPMNAIVGYTTLARDDDISVGEMREYLAKIDASSKHLLALINDILEMSRIESGKMELETDNADITQIANEVHDLFIMQMKQKNITYNVVCDDSLTDRFVICDRNRLNRVLLNLVSNAYKFTPEGGTVDARFLQTGNTEDGSGIYEIHIKDSGIGMTKEFAEKVFEAFERERTSTVSGIQGTGLGMAITKSIVDLMGGQIKVNTAPGKGTEFVVYLTLAKGDGSAIAAETNRLSAEKAAEIDFTKMRLLLVDDIMINREIAAKVLRKFGFTVETAENGKEAVDKVSASQAGYYDAVLMDIQMPVMDGYDAAAQIRGLPDRELAAVPIVAMTANAFSEDVQKAHDAGMNAHVAKPIDVDNLKQTLTEILS